MKPCQFFIQTNNAVSGRQVFIRVNMIDHFTECIYRISCFNYFSIFIETLIEMVYNILIVGYSLQFN